MTWRPLDKPLQPWVSRFDLLMGGIKLPTLNGSLLAIASDFAGNHKSKQYKTYAYLCFDRDSSFEWELKRRSFRDRYLPGNRTMTYKSFNDIHRRRALWPFLRAAESLHGVCLVIIVDKRIARIAVHRREEYREWHRLAGLKASWKDAELEEALRATHFVGLLVGGLSRPSQDIRWYVDEDNMFGNAQQTEDVTRMLSFYSGHYASFPLGELELATNAVNEAEMFEEDVTAIPDLVAGALAESASDLSCACGGHIPSNVAIPRRLPAGKAHPILRWFWTPGRTLTRIAIMFAMQPDGRCDITRHEFGSR